MDRRGTAFSADWLSQPRYDAATQTVHATVQNTLSQVLCYVQAEPHLKSGTKTVGELGPDVLGHLSPGQETTSSVSVASESNLAGISFDGHVVHLEVFDCAGSGPAPHTGGAGAESGSGESGTESGSEFSGDSEEGSGAANMLALDETFDMVRAGARLILRYDAPSNSFKGTVENTTNGVLSQVRIEVHLSNGTELGPTPPIDMAPGEVAAINLPATAAAFTGWIAMPRSVVEARAASLGVSMAVAAESPAANTLAVVSDGATARANRIRPMEDSSEIISPWTYPVDRRGAS